MSGPVKIIDERGVYPSALDLAAAEQAKAQRAAQIAQCDHDYQRSPYSSGYCIVIYECAKCGDEYERDVS